MCKCVETLSKQLAEYNSAFDTVIFFNTVQNQWESRIKLSMKKISPRGPKPYQMQINFCPFCGENWYAETHREEA